MYAGKIVEKAPTKTLLKNPVHPYSKALLNIIPDPDSQNRFKLKEVPPGEPPGSMLPSDRIKIVVVALLMFTKCTNTCSAKSKKRSIATIFLNGFTNSENLSSNI